MKNRLENERRTGLARAISKLGFSSRSQADKLIQEGRVLLNGAQCRNPEAPVRVTKDRIEVDGRPIKDAKKLYLMLNKPRGIVTTTSDEKGRETVYDLLPQDLPWIAPVGRLDKASEGLLLLSNDSAWAAFILEPRNHFDKTYHVQVGTVATPELAAVLEKGIQDDAELLRAKRARVLRGGEKTSWLEIVLDEGKNRQIRRMLAAFNIEVLKLVRVAVGSVVLGNLPKSRWRELTNAEVEALSARIRLGRVKTNSSKLRA